MHTSFSYPKGTPPKEYIPIIFTEDSEVRISKNEKPSVEIGVGKISAMNRRKGITAIRKAVRTAKQHSISRISFDVNMFPFSKMNAEDEDLGRLLGENAEMAQFEFVKFKTGKDALPKSIEIAIVGATKDLIKGIAAGQIVGTEVNACRTLANTPAGHMTPFALASEAKRAAKGTPIKVSVLNVSQMKKLQMNTILAVGQGSSSPAQFIIMEYWGAPKSQAPVVLVGKGVTFDTGGINIKPDDHSLGMHLDMSGGAAMIHAIVAAAKLKCKKNVIALVPAVENMVSGNSYRPGDIIKSMSGQTIEVINTDAEGRLILADALTYAERYKPQLVVDAATLTGGALGMLGEKASVIMASEQKFETLFRELGEVSGEYVWPLPFWEEYEDGVKGIFADLANLPTKGNTRYASTIMGGMFLYQFAKKYPFVHMDIAPRMESTDGDYLARGAVGSPIRLLVRLIETI